MYHTARAGTKPSAMSVIANEAAGGDRGRMPSPTNRVCYCLPFSQPLHSWETLLLLLFQRAVIALRGDARPLLSLTFRPSDPAHKHGTRLSLCLTCTLFL